MCKTRDSHEAKFADLMGMTDCTYTFVQDIFERLVSRYQSQRPPRTIKDVVMKHSIAENGAQVIYMHWLDTQAHDHPLRVSFTFKNAAFDYSISKFLHHENVLEYFPDARKVQGYCKLEIEEISTVEVKGRVSIADDKATGLANVIKNNLLLSMWFTLNKYIGELNAFHVGENVSALEVMRIYKYFAALLSIENFYICDDMELIDESGKYSMPCRVISALATGKTFFQEHHRDLELADAVKFKLPQHPVYQNVAQRNRELNQLRCVKLQEWHKKMNVTQQAKLVWLFEKNKQLLEIKLPRNDKPSKEIDFKDKTLGDLASVLLDKAKPDNNLSQELVVLGQLLCGNEAVNFARIPLNEGDPLKETKSLLHGLLWGSVLWKVRAPKSNSLEGMPDESTNNRF